MDAYVRYSGIASKKVPNIRRCIVEASHNSSCEIVLALNVRAISALSSRPSSQKEPSSMSGRHEKSDENPEKGRLEIR